MEFPELLVLLGHVALQHARVFLSPTQILLKSASHGCLSAFLLLHDTEHRQETLVLLPCDTMNTHKHTQAHTGTRNESLSTQ